MTLSLGSILGVTTVPYAILCMGLFFQYRNEFPIKDRLPVVVMFVGTIMFSYTQIVFWSLSYSLPCGLLAAYYHVLTPMSSACFLYRTWRLYWKYLLNTKNRDYHKRSTFAPLPVTSSSWLSNPRVANFAMVMFMVIHVSTWSYFAGTSMSSSDAGCSAISSKAASTMMISFYVFYTIPLAIIWYKVLRIRLDDSLKIKTELGRLTIFGFFIGIWNGLLLHLLPSDMQEHATAVATLLIILFGHYQLLLYPVWLARREKLLIESHKPDSQSSVELTSSQVDDSWIKMDIYNLLSSIRRNSEARELLYHHLCSELSSENLLFLEKIDMLTDDPSRKKVQDIFTTFFSVNARDSINISYEMEQEICSAYREWNETSPNATELNLKCVDALKKAANEVTRLIMQDSFLRFCRLESNRRCLAKIVNPV